MDVDKERIRERLQRELECLRALGIAPEQFAAARHARSVRRRRPARESQELDVRRA